MKALRLTAIVIVSAGIIAAAIFLLTLTSCACGEVPYAAAQKAAVPTGQPERIIAILRSVEWRLNVPGANCGYHYDLTVDVAGRGRQVLHVYDMRVSEASLTALEGRTVEIDFAASEIVASIRAAGGRDAVARSGLFVIKHC